MSRLDIEPGWISRATFMDLPKRFQVAALELAKRGEIIIQDTNIEGQPRGTIRNDRSHAGH